MTSNRPDPRPAHPTVACPGGRAEILAEHVIPGDADTGDVVIQTLVRADGRRFVRIGYRRAGRLIRGPVSVPEEHWTKLPRRAPKATA